MKIYTATPKRGRKVEYDAVEFRGNMSEVDVAAWAHGRLKGGSGRFVIEIEQKDKPPLVVEPLNVILRSASGATRVITSLEATTKYNLTQKEDR